MVGGDVGEGVAGGDPESLSSLERGGVGVGVVIRCLVKAATDSSTRLA